MMFRRLLRTSIIHKQDPLKQGLKRRKCAGGASSHNIHKQDPLKQGLKQYFNAFRLSYFALFISKIH